MSDWKEYRLGDVTEWASGGTPSKKIEGFWNGNIPWISASSMGGNRYSQSKLMITESGLKAGSRLAEQDSILLLVRGSTLHQRILVGITERDVAFNQDVKSIKPKQEYLDSWYLLFWFMSMEKELLDMVENTGIGAGKLVTKLLQNLIIKIPPQNERGEIIACAKAIDDKLILNRQTNQTLEQIAQAIFKSWFVDFEPTRAKIAAKKRCQALHQSAESSSPTCYGEQLDSPNQNGSSLDDAMTQAAMAAISGKTEEQLKDLNDATLQQLKITADLFPDALVESELGKVPEGWDIKPLTEIAENHSTTFDFSKVDEVVFVNTGDVLEGRFLHKKYSSKVGLPGQAKKTIKRDDILYSEIRPKNKRFAYVTGDCDDYVVSTKFMIVRSLGFVHPRYLYQILRQEATIQEFNLIAESRSGTFPQITFDSIGYLPVVVPTERVQKSFMEFFTPFIEKIDLVVAEGKSLTKLRDSLLPRLLSGQLSFEEAA